MIAKSSTNLRDQVLSNGAYKIVALIAAIILWLTVLGRKEVIYNKEIPINIVHSPKLMAIYDTGVQLQIKVRGRRKLVHDFREMEFPMTISLKDRGAGVYSVPLTVSNVHIPVGLRVLSIHPRSLQVELVNKDNE